MRKTAKKRPVPTIFKPYLWSYDIKKMDLEKNQKTVILDVLIHGTMPAWKKLFNIYGVTKIKNVFLKSREDTWNVQAYNFWKMKFGI